MGSEQSTPSPTPAAHAVDSRVHKRFLQLASVDEPKDRVSRDAVVAILAAPGAEDFGALLYDADPRYSASSLDESAYIHAVAGALGFSVDDAPVPPRAKFYFHVFGGGKEALDRAEFTKLVRSAGSLAMASFFPGRHPLQDDNPIVQSVVKSAMGSHDLITNEQFTKWAAANCPDFFAGAMRWVELQGLAHEQSDEAAPQLGQVWTVSHTMPALLKCEGERNLMVNRHMLWLLSCCLPPMYRNAPSWTLLYNSVLHGHGANRFFNHVLHYKGPTLFLARDQEGDVIVACVDEEWKSDSALHFGGSNSHLFFMLPMVCQYRSAVKVHVDLKTRHAAHGIGIGPDPAFHHAMLWVHSDLQGGVTRFDPALPPGTTKHIHINTVEVWGCAAPEAAEKQSYERTRDQWAAEQRQKVRDPGSWMDNPDRFLLGLAGISVDTVSRISTQTR